MVTTHQKFNNTSLLITQLLLLVLLLISNNQVVVVVDALSLVSGKMQTNSTNCYRCTSSDTIFGLDDTFVGSGVVPYPRNCPAAPDCDLYITPSSCLGWNG